MIGFPETMEQLLQCTPTRITARVVAKVGPTQVELLQIELVYVDKDGRIVGDEAGDYKPKEGEVAVWAFS